MKKESLVKYEEYRDSDEDFQLKLRMTYEWDDVSYQFFISLLDEVQIDYKKEGLIPVHILNFYAHAVDRIIGLCSHPDFRRNLNTEELPLLEERKKQLLEKKNSFFKAEFYQSGPRVEPTKDSLKKYVQYVETEDHMELSLRLTYSWNDEVFFREIALITDVLNEYKKDSMIPVTAFFFFTGISDRIIGTISNPLFSKGLSPEEIALVEERKNQLLSMKEKFVNGEYYNDMGDIQLI